MKMKAVLSVLFLVALTGAATALFRRKYISVDQEMSWNGAQKYCRDNYVDLATIENQVELQNVSTFDLYWIGLYRNQNVQPFTMWSDGSTSNFRSWGSEQPETDNDKNCVYTSNSSWYNNYCNSSNTFVCYTWIPEVTVVQKMNTWEEALKFCRMKYTDLISLDTERDHILINNKTSEILTPRFWTGLRFLDGSWFWVKKASKSKQTSATLNFMPSCPAPHFHCVARNTASNVLENRDCEEKMNFICYK